MTTKESEVDVLLEMENIACLIENGIAEECDGAAVRNFRAAVAEVFERAEYLCRTGEGMIALRAALRDAGVKV